MEQTVNMDNVKVVVSNNGGSTTEVKEVTEFCIVRTNSAGVFAGHIKSRDGDEVVMSISRRIWEWSGANSLSQLAIEGTKDPANCKFPCNVFDQILLGVIEIIPCTAQGRDSINAVPVWAA